MYRANVDFDIIAPPRESVVQYNTIICSTRRGDKHKQNENDTVATVGCRLVIFEKLSF